MKSVIGYSLAIGGLVIMAIGLGTIKLELAILEIIKPMYISILGGIMILGGVFFLKFMGGSNGKAKQAKEEVPIYEGDKIVGYRRESD